MVVAAVVVDKAGCWQKYICMAYCRRGARRASFTAAAATHRSTVHARGGEAKNLRIDGGLRGCVLRFDGDACNTQRAPT